MDGQERSVRPPRNRDMSAVLVLSIGVAPLIALSVAAYLPIRSADFVLDDRVVVADNPVVERGDLEEIFSSPYWAAGPQMPNGYGSTPPITSITTPRLTTLSWLTPPMLQWTWSTTVG